MYICRVSRECLIIAVNGLNYEGTFKQWWSTIPPISTKQTITYHLHSLSTKPFRGGMLHGDPLKRQFPDPIHYKCYLALKTKDFCPITMSRLYLICCKHLSMDRGIHIWLISDFTHLKDFQTDLTLLSLILIAVVLVPKPFGNQPYLLVYFTSYITIINEHERLYI